jgi:heat shock protein HtpX
MTMMKRIFLFLCINLLVVISLSLLLNLLGIQPYLQSYGLDIKHLALFCLVWGMGGALISLSLSRLMAKWLLGVTIIDPNTTNSEERLLLEFVHKLSREAGLKHTPEVGIYSSSEVNAFATGPTQKRSLVAVSSGLLNRMDRNEIEAILGHEITHVANGDMVTMTLLQGVVNAFVMFLARILAFALSGLGREKQQNSSLGSFRLFTFLFEILFMILGSMLVAAFSRYREFRADKGGATIAGREKMISALKTLRIMQEIKDPHLKEAPALAAFKISAPAKRGWIALFATHPPLEERIARLEKL